MTASFNLTLDTHAPVVTWGGVGGTNAGELLQVGYQLDEPALISAELVLSDGRRLAMADTGLTLELNLPADTPDGWATIRALVRDDVLNEATRTLAVRLTGTIVQPQPEPSVGGLPTPPRPTRRRRRRTVTSRSTVRPRGATAVTTYAAKRATAIASSSTATAAAGHSQSAIRVIWGVVHHTTPAPTSRVQSRVTTAETIERRDGPSIEALLLGLL